MAQHDHRGGHIVVHNPGGGGGGGGYTDDIIQSIPVPADRIGYVHARVRMFAVVRGREWID